MEESLEQLLEIIKIDKTWENKKANNFMLAIFKELGNASPLTQKYRKLMQRLLYWEVGRELKFKRHILIFIKTKIRIKIHFWRPFLLYKQAKQK